MQRTLLDELEAIGNVALVAYKEQPTRVSSLFGSLLFGSDFASELNAAAYDTPTMAEIGVGNVCSRTRLACVSRERASVLGCLIVGVFEIVEESIISFLIGSQGRIVLEWG